MIKRAASVLLTISLMQAQQVGTNVPTGGTHTFTASAQLVVETVVVKDKDGKPIEGLKASDFTITEDNAPQAIKFFEYQKLADKSDPLPERYAAPTAPFAKLTRTQIQPEAPGDLRY